MRKYVLAALLLLMMYSCEKEKLTKARTWVNLTYRIQSNDSNLQVQLMRGIFTDSVKGNIAIDTLLVNPGTYIIPATVLTGLNVTLYGMSKVGPNFHLTITDEDGNLLKQTDSVIFYPASPANPSDFDKWVSKISVVPQ